MSRIVFESGTAAALCRAKKPMMNKQNMHIHFIGSGDAVGSGGRYQNCILVRSASDSFLIDCGASSLAALKAANIDLSDISTILISDLQGNHFGGMWSVRPDSLNVFAWQWNSSFQALPTGMEK